MVLYEELSAEDKVKRCKIKMYKRHPFFAYILLYMKQKEMDERMSEHFKKDNNVPTMAVDPSGNLYYSPEWVNTLGEEELIGTLAHEALHIAFIHLLRMGSRHMQVWNISTDLVANAILKEAGFRLPPGGLIPTDRYEFTFKQGVVLKDLNKRSGEDIYEEILPHIDWVDGNGGRRGDGDGDGDGDGNGGIKSSDLPEGHDHHIHDKGKDPRDQKDKEQQWRKRVAEAATMAKQQGKLPAGMQSLIEELLDQKVDWRTYLYKYVVAQIPFDYSWSSPGKRGISQGIYLPRVLKESVEILMHIDTSGSMANDEMSQALGEMQGILKAFSNVKINVMVGDAEMQNTFVLTKENEEDILEYAKEMKGGGGTDHKYVFKYVKENHPEAKLLILFTDGYTSFPSEHEHPFDVLWLVTEHGVPKKDIPFGEVIKMKKDGIE